jgi:hypothetical protein
LFSELTETSERVILEARTLANPVFCNQNNFSGAIKKVSDQVAAPGDTNMVEKSGL